MRQLVYRDSCTGGAIRVEKLRINGVIGREIGHVHQECADLAEVLEAAAECAKNIRYVLDDGSRLRADIECRISFCVNRCACDRVVRPARTGARNENKITASLCMRKGPAWFGLVLECLAGHCSMVRDLSAGDIKITAGDGIEIGPAGENRDSLCFPFIVFLKPLGKLRSCDSALPGRNGSAAIAGPEESGRPRPMRRCGCSGYGPRSTVRFLRHIGRTVCISSESYGFPQAVTRVIVGLNGRHTLPGTARYVLVPYSTKSELSLSHKLQP